MRVFISINILNL